MDTNVSRRSFVRNAAVGSIAAAGTAALAASTARADEASQIAWDKEADILGVGSGSFTMTAAVMCAEAGYSVIVVDKNELPGGCSMTCGGNMFFQGPVETENGTWADLDPEECIASLTASGDQLAKRNDPALVRRVVEKGQEILDFVVAHGVELYEAPSYPNARLSAFDYEENPGPGFAYQWYGEDAGSFCGSGFMWPLINAAVAAGAEVDQNQELDKLYCDETGRVIGGRVQTADGPINIKANVAVLLGCGSWKGSPTLRRLFDPRLPADMKASGEPYAVCDGAAIEAALAIGAALCTDRGNDNQLFRDKFGTPWYNYRLNSGVAAPGISPTATQSECFIYVNGKGERFVAETVAPSSAAMADAQLAQDDLTRWMVFDQTGIDTYGWDVTEPQCDPEYSFKADTLEELAELIGVPADALVQTVETYNGYVEAGEDADFGKDPEKLTVKIENGPFYGIGVVMFIHDSEGGLAIDGNCQVVNYKYEPIPGLYAGGDAAGGLSLLGTARSVPQGYIAGQHIVSQA